MFTKVEKEWTTEAGFKAVAVMTTFGTRNGYIEIDLDPRLEYYCSSVNLDTIEDWTPDLIAKQRHINNLEVHGGVTFLGKILGGRKAIGFDCNHAWDAPDWDTADKLFGDDPDYQLLVDSRKSMYEPTDAVVRTLDYVIAECESLAKQLKEGDLL